MNMTKNYDTIIIGGGPSGAFCALELVRLGKANNTLIIEQGKRVESRKCPKIEVEEKIKKGLLSPETKVKCCKCQPHCHITSGFSGAGAFSDGKLSLYNPLDREIHVGGELPDYIGTEETKKLIDYTDKIYVEFGADKNLEGVGFDGRVQTIRQQAMLNGISLVNIPIRHLGTEMAHQLYKDIEDYLIRNHVEILFETTVSDLIIEDGHAKGVIISENGTDKRLYCNNVVAAIGRKGAQWLSNMCTKHSIKANAGTVDIGIRYELPDEIMAEVNETMYEAKFIARLEPYKDKVRTFCQNPSGFVSEEVYDDGTALVNGHSYKEKKSSNTNLAILVSHNFKEPFNDSIGFALHIAKITNQLSANGGILVQRLGDVLKGKRTWENELSSNSVIPTLRSAVPGDITYAYPYRTMTDILQFIKGLDNVIPGFADPANLLYAPEAKFYCNKLKLSSEFETSIKGLYSIGDGGGLTRGLMMASCSGVHIARVLAMK